MEWRPRIGLVLGGGGSVGHGFHRGVLAALEDATGFDPGGAAVIVGTSSGASTASLLRAGVTGSDLAARACNEPCSARMAEIRRSRGLASVTRTSHPRLTLGPPASPRGVAAALRRAGPHLPGTLASALLPAGSVPTVSSGGPLDTLFAGGWPRERLWVVALRLDDGARVVIGRHDGPETDVATAVAASCALPGCYSPVVIDGARYVDGAAWSTTNADVLLGEPLDLVVVIAPLCGPGTLFHHLQRHYLDDEARRLRQAGVPVVVIDARLADLAVMGANVMNRNRRDAATRFLRSSTLQRLQRGDLVEAAELIRAMAGRRAAALPPAAASGSHTRAGSDQRQLRSSCPTTAGSQDLAVGV